MSLTELTRLTHTTDRSSGGGGGGGVVNFFEMDYSSGAAPLAGWTAKSDEASNDYTATRMAGIGPSGEDGYRMELTHNGVTPGDKTWAWGRNFGAVAPFVYGDSVFARFRFRFIPGFNGRAYVQGGTTLGGVWRNKLFITNDAGSGANERYIIGLQVNRDPLLARWDVSLSGGGNIAATTWDWPINTDWIHFQYELQHSSAVGVADGAHRLWINNNVQGTPSLELTGIVVNAEAEPGHAKFGFYFNNGEYSDGVIGYDHVGFQLSENFDPNWSLI